MQENEKSSTDELPTRFAVELFFVLRVAQVKKSKDFFPMSYLQGHVVEAVESARAGLSPKKGDVRKKRRRPRKVVCRHKKGT